jgi:hypothetical protein
VERYDSQYPTRARAVLAYIDDHLNSTPGSVPRRTRVEEMRLRARSFESKRGGRGHPGNVNPQDRKRALSNISPAEQQRRARWTNAWMSKELDGVSVGSLRLAAEQEAPVLLEVLTVDGVNVTPRHSRYPELFAKTVDYLVGVWGEVMRSFPFEPAWGDRPLPSFEEWEQMGKPGQDGSYPPLSPVSSTGSSGT